VKPEEDDDLLPPLPPLADDDDDALPDAGELGLDALLPDDAEAAESVGLDDDTGLEDDAPLYALELPPEETAIDEEDVDAIPVEGLDEGAEYGWTDDGASQADEGWDPAEMDLPTLSPLGGDDGGEVGLDDAIDLGGRGADDVSHLPPLDADEGDEDDAGDDLLLDVAAMITDVDEAPDRSLPAPLEGVAVTHLGPREGAAAVRPPYVGGAASVWVVRGEGCERLGSGGLEAAEVVAVAGDGDALVVSTAAGEVLRSDDAGASFAPVTSFGKDAAQSFHLRREAGTTRLWGRTGGGALHASDDFGRTWKGPLLLKRVVAIVTPPTGGVMVLCAGRDAPPQLAWTEDGGGRWSAVDGPGLPAEGEMSLAYGDGYVAVACAADVAGPFLSSDAGKTWARVPGLPPAGPIALVKERGGLSLYAAHLDGDRGVIVRHRPGGGEAGLVLDVAEEAERLGLDGPHRIVDLSLACDGDRTVLHAATGVGVFRVTVEPET